ncbi:MAG: ankyrin repeat domain-containing protein [Candidatus Sulfotelmatobacter sp.]
MNLATLKIAGSVVVAASIVWGQAATPSTRLDAALISAADEGDAVRICSLLKRGANPNAARSDGSSLTALMLAALGGHSKAVRLLLEAGAEVNTKATVVAGVSGANVGLTALMEAVSSGDAATVLLLLERKADPNAKVTYETADSTGVSRIVGFDPTIMQAANLAVLRLLVDYGADLHAKDGDGNSVLMYAAENLDSSAVEYLLSKGLDPGERNSKGQSALDLARQEGKKENVAILEKAAR